MPEEQGRSAYVSTRRVFRIIDRVSREGDRLTVKALAEDLEISISTCYHLLSLLVQEGYVVKLPHRAGYRLGPTIPVLGDRLRRSDAATIDPMLLNLAERSGCSAYFAVLDEHDEVLVMHVRTTPDSPPVGLPAGFRGPSHALALGKVLIAAGGVDAINRYINDHVLDAYTRRTITDPSQLEAHLKTVRARGFATDFEEFAKNLYCVAVPVPARGAGASGAIGLGTTAGVPAGEIKRLIRLAHAAAVEVAAAG
jgi:IclR family acetate operon transcriptional repressor